MVCGMTVFQTVQVSTKTVYKLQAGAYLGLLCGAQYTQCIIVGSQYMVDMTYIPGTANSRNTRNYL